MKILGIQTSTFIWSVAVVDDEQILGEYTFNSPACPPVSGAGGYKRLSKILVPAIDELLSKTGLKMKELDGIVVTTGPGSFTGGRIGISVAKGLSMGLNIPVVGISTLEALASKVSYTSYSICPLLPSRGQEVYTAVYKVYSQRMKETEKALVVDIEDWLNNISNPTVFIGEGAVKYRNVIKKRLEKLALFAPLSLNYLRASDIAFQASKKLMKTNKISSLNLKAEYLRPAIERTKKKRK
jgi:tRNA threonylcarbamoyladenosine biosynthesis protein TsaB